MLLPIFVDDKSTRFFNQFPFLFVWLLQNSCGLLFTTTNGEIHLGSLICSQKKRRALKQRMGTNANYKIPKINSGRGSCFRREITFETNLNHRWYVPSGVDHNEESSCSNKMPLDLTRTTTGKSTQSRATYLEEHACKCVYNVSSRINDIFFALIAFSIPSLHHTLIECMEVRKILLRNLRLTTFQSPIVPSKRQHQNHRLMEACVTWLDPDWLEHVNISQKLLVFARDDSDGSTKRTRAFI